jgi:hypothetical protein
VPDLNAIRSLVQDAIDRGATSVEEVHRSIAAMPLEALKKVAPGPATMAQGLQDQTIGTVYDAIRGLNDQAGQIAQKLLGGGSTPD